MTTIEKLAGRNWSTPSFRAAEQIGSSMARSGGNGPAVLTAPLNIGVGTK